MPTTAQLYLLMGWTCAIEFEGRRIGQAEILADPALAHRMFVHFAHPSEITR